MKSGYCYRSQGMHLKVRMSSTLMYLRAMIAFHQHRTRFPIMYVQTLLREIFIDFPTKYTSSNRLRISNYISCIIVE